MECACGILRATESKEGEGVLRGRDGVAARRIHDDHAASRRGLDIDVIDADAGAADDAEARSSLQYRRRHFRLTADHDRAELGNERHQIRFAQTCAHDDIQSRAGCELVDAALGNGISD